MSKPHYPYCFFKAADKHGEDSGELDHTVGDLQMLFDIAWNILTPAQKLVFLHSTGVREVITGAVGEKAADRLLPR